jgi:hypothetical protein
MGMRHVDRSAFITHVHNSDPLAGDMIPDRLYVTALQPKNSIDSTLLKKMSDPCRNTVGCGVQVLLFHDALFL